MPISQVGTLTFTTAMNKQFGGYETMNRFHEKNDYGVFANQIYYLFYK
jgi:hypothetical protein